MTKELVARIAAVTTTTYILVGFPAQIWRVWQRGTASDLSGAMLSLSVLTFVSWTIMGIMRPRNLAIAIPNFLGAVCATALLVVWLLLNGGR